MPTFKRLQSKHPGARMMWFQNGKLWTSRLEAQEAMHVRGERGRSADPKQFGFRARKKLDWKPRGVGENLPVRRSSPSGGGSSPGGERQPRRERPEWKPRGEAESPSRSSRPRERSKLDWKPRDESASRPSTRDELPRRKPAARSGSGRDKTWRPGGEHKDPRQKYKDAKKAKWQRLKTNIRSRWEAKQGKKRDK